MRPDTPDRSPFRPGTNTRTGRARHLSSVIDEFLDEIAPKPKARYRHGCLSPEERGEEESEPFKDDAA